MKKIKIFIIVLILILPLITKAEESINYEWGTYAYSNYSYISNVYEVSDGYIFSSQYNSLIKSSKDGTFIKSSEGSCTIAAQTTDGIMCLNYGNKYESGIYNYTYYIDIYDENLNIKTEKTYTYSTTSYNSYLSAEYDYYVIETDEYWYLSDLYHNYKIYKISKTSDDFSILNLNDLTDSELKNYLGEYYFIAEAYQNASNDGRDVYYYDYESNDNYKMLAYYDNNTDKAGFELYDQNGNQLYYQNIDNYEAQFTLSEYGVYVISTDSNLQSKLEKYDFADNKVYEQDLTQLNKDYRGEREITNIKIVSDGLIVISNFDAIPVSLDEELTGYQPAILKYSFTYNITSKINGKGEVNTASTAKGGNEVTFTVTPDSGYVLSALKITDENGNTVTYTEGYTFTMPASDVTIEATFAEIVSNPETQDIAISIITILAILAIIVVIDNRKKLKWLK